MMRQLLPFLIFCLILPVPLFAQDNQTNTKPLDDISLDSIDDLFSETMDDNESAEVNNSDQSDAQTDVDVITSDNNSVLKDLTAQTGGSLTVRYAFAAGLAPGWSEAPWFWDDQNEKFTRVIGADLSSDFIFDFQLSPRLRVYQAFLCDFPDYSFTLDTFWAEYNLSNNTFFKLGNYTESWGLSGNYSFANILSRLPENRSSGDPYTFRMNLPVGVGGVQVLTMTRSGWVNNGNIEDLEAGDLGYGIKLNYAHPLADINVGLFYHELMPLRVIVTSKTTFFDSMELFIQGLVSIPDEQIQNTVYSGSIGVVDDFFKDKLTVNLEYFYNGEVYTNVVETDEGWVTDEVSPFIKGHNVAFNLYCNTRINNLSVFSRLLYNFNENTGKWAPGLRYKPYNDMSLILSVPSAVGTRIGTYYNSNYDKKNRPFSVTLAVTLSGIQKFAHYE